MNYRFLALAFLLFVQCQNGPSIPGAADQPSFPPIEVSYPQAYRDSSMVDSFGQLSVLDPYRWLESTESASTSAWIEAQNKITQDYLKQIPFRGAIRSRLEELWNYERFSSPQKHGEFYYHFRNAGLQNQDILYRQSTLEAEPEKVLDPNQFSSDGTTALGSLAFSGDGQYLAFELSAAGSDWREIRIMDLSSKQLLPEKIQWVKFSNIAWAGNGFYYSRYPQPNAGSELSVVSEFQSVYYHEIGTTQAEDRIVFTDRSRPNRRFRVFTTEDERYLLLSIHESTSGNALYFQDLREANSGFVPIVEDIEDDYFVIGNLDQFLLVLTNHEADHWKLMRVSTRSPEQGFWEDILPNGEDILHEVHLFGGKLVASYLHNAHSKLRIFDLDGKLESEVDLPGLGMVQKLSGRSDDLQVFFQYNSFIQPGSIYRLNLQNQVTSVYRAPKINFNQDQYETKQVWYNSYDGTRVPMFVTHKKGLEMNGDRPTLLYGYGGFDISILPQFKVDQAIILENDGIVAVANLRGGGEFGKEWHEAGMLGRKQNVFDDFQSAAEYLVAQGYTRKEKLAIEGRSNGGLLVGACLTQRPDLFQVAFPAVGVLDMLRYHKFTIGAAWAGEYGRSDVPEELDFLMAYSPYHNVLPTSYPATLVTTADHDDRVFPAHSFKFAAELQHQQQGDAPVLIRIETQAGHGAGKSTSKQIAENADKLSFFFYNIKQDPIYGKEQ